MRDMSESEWFSAPPAIPLTGSEPLSGTDATVHDFWRFAMSDLRMNNVRGYLAEFLVAKAVGATGQRIEWDAFDVLTPDGTRIEVKSSAYLQVWDQRHPSRIVFTGLTGRTWSPQAGEAPTATYNADIYVFAIQTAQTHDQYDPLDVSQWSFYVLDRGAVEHLGYNSISLATLARVADAVPYEQLSTEITSACAP